MPLPRRCVLTADGAWSPGPSPYQEARPLPPGPPLRPRPAGAWEETPVHAALLFKLRDSLCVLPHLLRERPLPMPHPPKRVPGVDRSHWNPNTPLHADAPEELPNTDAPPAPG